MSVEPRLTFNLIESSRSKSRDGAARAYRTVLKSEKPLGTDEVIRECVQENTDTRLVVAFPTSPVLTPDLVLGQPGQVARFEFSKTTKKNARQHGRRADVTFAE